MHRAFSLIAMTNRLEPLEMQLFEARVTPATRISYRRHYDDFIQYCRRHRFDVRRFTPANYDTALYKYITFLCRTHQSRGRGATTISALIFYLPELENRLPYSIRIMKGWMRLQPSRSHAPLTWPITVLIAATMAQSGYHGMALATLVAFDCYLRINEYVNILMAHITLNSNGFVFIRIRRSKTGDNQSVTVSNPHINLLLRRWADRRRLTASQQDSLFDIPSASHYRLLFQKTVTSLGLTDCHYVPHSLRHGGATHSYAEQVPVKDIAQRGRWKSFKTVQRYVQAALAIRLDAVIPPLRAAQADQWKASFYPWMSDALFGDQS
jgi:integrase